MRLDRLAVDASACLQDAGVPHALLKGPTTAWWLYQPPRPYNDVDLLVPRSAVRRAERSLTAAGVATASAGRLGEEASHSLLMRTSAGLELDLHVTLPMLPEAYDRAAADRVWALLAGHVESFMMDDHRVPAFDVPARCLVLALHALGNGPEDVQSLEDLRRARLHAPASAWDSAAALAKDLGVANYVDAALALVEPRTSPVEVPADVQLRLQGGSGSAFRLERLSRAPKRLLPGLLLRELLPSPGFMRHADPSGTATTRLLALAYLRRILVLAVELPSQWRTWRNARTGVG